jgi:hypothetical protein
MFLENIQTRPRRHRRRNTNNFRIVLRQTGEGLPKHLGVTGGLGFTGWFGFARCQIKGILGVIPHLVLLRHLVALALRGRHVHQHRSTDLVRPLKRIN